MASSTVCADSRPLLDSGRFVLLDVKGMNLRQRFRPERRRQLLQGLCIVLHGVRLLIGGGPRHKFATRLGKTEVFLLSNADFTFEKLRTFYGRYFAGHRAGNVFPNRVT